ncbi:dsRNA-specific ribonuclease [Metarhizium robertsii]|uniref:Large ribosomal subunit protein mL44 n=2 Tax=Metarhizium robertsii TaxID=568076 RepID=E9EMM8_METRA|nr:Ribonuclease III [Metarhizium robertsii ARSEF 23]EFZ04047.1 Ribonuclease III [Metarhizium robertsii ARSEF 23]EXV00987.1 dsRNA-specific ribonuclease [Metarhizium robertsii]
MKRLRVSQWSSKQLLRARPGASSSVPIAIAGRQPFLQSLRCQSSAAIAPEHLADDAAAAQHITRAAPSPPHQRSLESAKLAALHARLALSPKIPLQTLARALITPSADANGSFNNSNLAFLGSTIINYHVLEYLVCKWPRLPMAILYEALRAFSGQESLQQVARRWGVEAAAAPGEEVDAGLLQWKADGVQLVNTRWGYVRSEVGKDSSYRRGMSSRVVLDDVFGDALSKPDNAGRQGVDSLQNEAFASFVQAVVGSIYAHCGREAAKSFVTSHILSRQFDPSELFQFQLPTRELAMLCAREGFEAPVARLESETGRLSKTPVFVVGIYSGKEKLGEGAGPSLDIARRKASMNVLKAWYLYCPGNKVRVPSDMMEEGARPWKAPHIDVGEII